MLKVNADLQAAAIKLADVKSYEVFIRAWKSRIIKEKLDFNDEKHFREMDKKSESLGCGCELCRLRYEYTKYKLIRHRAVARLKNDNFVYTDILTETADWETVDWCDYNIAELHFKKELIKNMLGYDKSKSSTKVSISVPIHWNSTTRAKAS